MGSPPRRQGRQELAQSMRGRRRFSWRAWRLGGEDLLAGSSVQNWHFDKLGLTAKTPGIQNCSRGRGVVAEPDIALFSWRAWRLGGEDLLPMLHIEVHCACAEQLAHRQGAKEARTAPEPRRHGRARYRFFSWRAWRLGGEDLFPVPQGKPATHKPRLHRPSARDARTAGLYLGLTAPGLNGNGRTNRMTRPFPSHGMMRHACTP